MTDRIILASASPRRSELLKQAGLSFAVIPSKAKETITSTHPAEVVEELSSQKAWEVADRILRGGEDVTDFDVVIGADTVVAVDHQILGKPVDHDDAANMILSDIFLPLSCNDPAYPCNVICALQSVLDLTSNDNKEKSGTFPRRTFLLMYNM